MPQTVEQKTSDSSLRLITKGTASVTGDEFFRTLVRYLASALQVRCAFVAEFAGVKTRVRTLAFWSGDCLLDNFEFDLGGTPCEAVLAGEMRLYKKGIQALFPKDKGLIKLGAESYLAVPLVARSGGVSPCGGYAGRQTAADVGARGTDCVTGEPGGAPDRGHDLAV